MGKRKALSAKVRFEVFKRDSFKCQYCGACAPEVLLRVDHIEPVSKGGADDILNLITACHSCNAGKGATALGDDTALAKQRQQLDELAERREQLEMMVAWRKGLNEIDASALQHAVEAFNSLTDGRFGLNERGRSELKKLISKHGLNVVLNAVQKCGDHIIVTADGSADEESVQVAYSKIGPMCRGASMSDDERQLFYIRGICRNRFEYCNQPECINLLRRAYDEGARIEYLKQLALDSRNWTMFRRWMLEVIDENEALGRYPGWRTDSEMAKRRALAVGVSAQPGEELSEFVARVDEAVVAKHS